MFNVGDIIKRKESEVDEWYLEIHTKLDRFKVVEIISDGRILTHDDNGDERIFYAHKMELVSARYGMP